MVNKWLFGLSFLLIDCYNSLSTSTTPEPGPDPGPEPEPSPEPNPEPEPPPDLPRSVVTPDFYFQVSSKIGLYKALFDVYREQLEVGFSDVCSLRGDPKFDLLRAFGDVSRSINNQLPNTILNSVKTLNNHVLNRGSFTDINDFLSLYDVRVTQEWADLCSLTSVTINEDNIL